jgi:methionyl-tRNA synthetase
MGTMACCRRFMLCAAGADRSAQILRVFESMKDARSYYITTAIPYANGAPHIGHAYERIVTDTIARFKRLDGYDVLFVTGMDEHGQKMQQTAAREGLTPQQLADRTAAQFAALGAALAAPADDIVRTTQTRHHIAAQEIWARMAAAGDIYLSKYPGWYSVRDEAFFDESELTEASDGTRIAPTGAPVEWIEEETYYFKLSAYRERLLAHYRDHPEFVAPEKYRNEIVAFVERGLNDLSISRSTFDWGIPVPNDPTHVMYVWVDALTNYLTGTGFPNTEAPRKDFWPADAHVIGKDITRFHAIYWPAFLMSAGLPLPRQVVVHGFLFNRGEKMSKSVGNVIDPFALSELYGTDQFRYFLLREVPFGQDGNYSHEAIVARVNADLANDLGNLAQRSLSMLAKNCSGRLPVPAELQQADREILAQAAGLAERSRRLMEDFALHGVLAEIWLVIGDTNRYFAAEEPWVKRKTDPARMATILYVTAEVLRIVAITAQPFMPKSMARLLDLLGVATDARNLVDSEVREALSPGASLPEPTAIFPRFIDAEPGHAG